MNCQECIILHYVLACVQSTAAYFIALFKYITLQGVHFPFLQTMSFQAVVISDHATSETYVQYNYKECGTWTPGYDNAIFTFAKLKPYWWDWWSYWSPNYIFQKWALSGTPLAVGMANIPGNTGRPTLSIKIRVNDALFVKPSSYSPSEYTCRMCVF